MPELDEHILISMRVARQHHLSIFIYDLEEHRQHPWFIVEDWPRTLEKGFACSCSGVEREWRISCRSLREGLPEARESTLRLLSTTRQKQDDTINSRAKILLNQHLTCKQRLDLESTKSFLLTAKDNYTYRITEGSCNNVHRIEKDGTEKFSLCVVSEEQIPTYDLMLAQKLLLETDSAAFLTLARVQDLITKEMFDSGSFLAYNQPPPRMPPKQRGELIPIPNDVLDAPANYLNEVLNG